VATQHLTQDLVRPRTGSNDEEDLNTEIVIKRRFRGYRWCSCKEFWLHFERTSVSDLHNIFGQIDS